MTEDQAAVERQKDRVITKEEAQNSIYIDFEGAGRSPENPVPMPHMLGTFRPKIDNYPADYKAKLFKKSWNPVANGSRGEAEIVNFRELIESLIEEVQSRGGYLVYFSDHERKVIEVHCPDLYERFLSVGFNTYPPLRRMFNRQHANQNNIDRPDTLAGFMEHYSPNNQETGQITSTKGAADSCKRIDGYCRNEKRWGNWTDKQKAIALELLKYNKSDCRSTWKLTKKLANHLAR